MNRGTALVMLALAFVGCGQDPAQASPVTYTYLGSVTSTLNNSLVPLGSAATIHLTYDPAANLWAGNVGCGGPHPEGGAYAFTAVMDFTGRQYTATGYFEVNYDFYGCLTQGGVRQVQYTGGLNGPSLTVDPSYRPYVLAADNSLALCTAVGGPSRCQNAFIGPSDPLSAALPVFSSFGYRLGFGGDCSTLDPACLPGGALSGAVVVAGNIAPEPGTLLLIGSGLAVTMRRRYGAEWQRRRR